MSLSFMIATFLFAPTLNNLEIRRRSVACDSPLGSSPQGATHESPGRKSGVRHPYRLNARPSGRAGF